MATLYQAKPVLEIRRVDYGHGVFAGDRTEPLYESKGTSHTYMLCHGFILGFDKAWSIKDNIERFTEALNR